MILKCRYTLCWFLLLIIMHLDFMDSRGVWMTKNCPNGRIRNAVQLAYSSVNPTQGLQRDLAPIILLHELLHSRKSWNFMMQPMADLTGRKVYALDMRNHGESPWSNVFTIKQLSFDLEYFMHQHCIAKAILVGHSLGAKAVMSFVMRRPEKAEKVIFEDMYTKEFNDLTYNMVYQISESIKQAMSFFPCVIDNESAIKQSVGVIVLGSLISEDEQFEPKEIAVASETLPIRKQGERYVWEANLNVIERAVNSPCHLNQCLRGTYYGDALFIYGTKSPFNVPSDSTITKFFPRAQMVGMKNASHLIHTFSPKEFLSVVVNFINSQPTFQKQQFQQFF